MHLIIAEKNIVANRIAHILSETGKVSTKKEGGVNQYFFDDKISIGLRGHVVEVDFIEGYTNWRSEEHPPRSLIDAETLKRPTEPAIVRLIQKYAKKANRVTIATDFDTEGELIGKEAYELVRAINKTVPVDRARFSAITKEEIYKAFSNTTDLDFDLASAGEARQVVDLIWGASLTRFISLAAKRGGVNILSVGRVQSPTLAMIVDREKEIEAFIPEPYWEISLSTDKAGEMIRARHAQGKFTEKEVAMAAYSATRDPLLITEVKEGKRIDRAPTPFDTTTFIVAAARVGYSAANAMRLAETLYMNGFISYPRTDNTIYPPSLNLDSILTTLSKTQFNKEVSWVKSNRRKKPTEGKKSSTDHPPIHPTGDATPEQLGDSWKLYELVVRRFLATLSPDAEWATMRIDLDASGQPYIATGSRLTKPGWRMVYPYSEAKDTILPIVKMGERLKIQSLDLEEKQTQPPPRYTQSKLIQVMEELGLGTKSTRHEVIQKLVVRKYIEGNPLRPTLVGKAVTESLEAHAGAITKPDMTRTLEKAMEDIKIRKKNRDGVLEESRNMLHQVFDQLEPNESVIGQEIIGQTDEELTIGPCPVCGKDLRIRKKGGSQFIGCSGYPDCTCNMPLPGSIWGSAVRTKKVCDTHNLYHVSLIAKGTKPWEIGCPLCQVIEQQKQYYAQMPSMTDTIQERLIQAKIYNISELSRKEPAILVDKLSITKKNADAIINDALKVLDLIRKRSECKKFMKQYIPPKRGRSHTKVMTGFTESGINCIEDIASSEVGILKKTGLNDEEARLLKDEALQYTSRNRLRDMGISSVSLKRYQESSFITPEMIVAAHPTYLSLKTGISVDTVLKHLHQISQALNIPEPVKISRKQMESGRNELLSLEGMNEMLLEQFYLCGIFNYSSLKTANPSNIVKMSGLTVEQIKNLQTGMTS